MELIDRYVQAIRFWLPKDKQDDIAAEIREEVQSQTDDREALLGMQLSKPEIGEVLKRNGSPLLVASRYLPQQYLIGPALFPVYLFVLKVVALCALLPFLLAVIAINLFEEHHAVFSLAFVMKLWEVMIMALLWGAVITLIFAVLERAKVIEKWEPLKLPAVRVRNAGEIQRMSSVAELIANVVIAGWLLTGWWEHTLYRLFRVQVELTAAWRVYCWVFLLTVIANVAIALTNFYRPYWTGQRAWMRLTIDCVGAAAFCRLLQYQLVAHIVGPQLTPARSAQLVELIHTYMLGLFPYSVLACLLIVTLVDGGRLARGSWRPKPDTTPWATPSRP